MCMTFESLRINGAGCVNTETKYGLQRRLLQSSTRATSCPQPYGNVFLIVVVPDFRNFIR